MMLFKLRIEVPDLELGQAAAEIVEGVAEPSPLAVTLFEARPPSFVVEAYFDAAPPLDKLQLRLTERNARLAHASLEPVPDQNWVALSQASLPPIAAVIAHDGILVIAQGVEARVVAPRLLHELELTPDVGVDAEEMHASRLPIVHQVEQRPAGGIR